MRREAELISEIQDNDLRRIAMLIDLASARVADLRETLQVALAFAVLFGALAAAVLVGLGAALLQRLLNLPA